MATPDIVLGYPHIQFDSVTVTASSEDTTDIAKNTLTGSRSLIWQRASAGTSATITYDLGSGVTEGIRYAYFARADLLTNLVSGEIDLTVAGSTDNFGASNVTILSQTNLTTAMLMGPGSEDFILVQDTESTAYRYWRLTIASTSSYKYALSKFYLGDWFTFGDTSPIYPYETQPVNTSSEYTTRSGTTFRSRGGKPQLETQFMWRVTDAVKDDFRTKIADMWDIHTFVIYCNDATFYSPLAGHRLMHVRMTERPRIESRGKIRNNNYITCRFIQEVA